MLWLQATVRGNETTSHPPRAGEKRGSLSAATVISESPELQKEQGTLCSSRTAGPEAGPDSRS